jgi:para-nitrobenzyl esterase
MTGGGADAHVMAHRVSTAWINFARKGDPNHDGLPRWPAYTRENGNTMILDNRCGIRQHHDRELLEVTAGGPSLW